MKIPFLNIEITKAAKVPEQPSAKDQVRSKSVIAPSGARDTTAEGEDIYGNLSEKLNLVTPEFMFETIPTIRKLTITNSDFGQAIKNVINLGNTGHKIQFGPEIPADQADKMRKHLEEKGKIWAKLQGCAGMNGIVNRLMYQGMVSGSVVCEKVIQNDFKGLAEIPLIRPEKIRWVLNKGKKRYQPYELITKGLYASQSSYLFGNLKPLNANTLIYYGLYSDSEVPYGIPPYLPALDPIARQAKMLDNIDFIVEQMGLIGFLQVLLDKEDKQSSENEAQYRNRMQSLLDEAAARVKQGLRNGINVGFKDDTEFEFHSATKSVSGATDLFKENELQVLSGLLTDGSLMGRDYGSSESQITVVFMKMVAEHKNIQNNIKYLLEDIYTSELMMAGYRFNSLTVVFNASTLQDELKWQQGRQTKIANIQSEWRMGIINQETVAEDLDREKPDLPEPRVDVELAKKLEKEKAERDTKNDSARRTRRKQEPVEKSPEERRTRKSGK
jgi:hypothetical protein